LLEAQVQAARSFSQAPGFFHNPFFLTLVVAYAEEILLLSYDANAWGLFALSARLLRLLARWQILPSLFPSDAPNTDLLPGLYLQCPR